MARELTEVIREAENFVDEVKNNINMAMDVIENNDGVEDFKELQDALTDVKDYLTDSLNQLG